MTIHFGAIHSIHFHHECKNRPALKQQIIDLAEAHRYHVSDEGYGGSTLQVDTNYKKEFGLRPEDFDFAQAIQKLIEASPDKGAIGYKLCNAQWVEKEKNDKHSEDYARFGR